MKLRIIFILLALSAFSLYVSGQTKSEKDENVVVQMNYCINTLTNIIHNKSMAVLEHESDQLVNNLTMEQIIGLHEIKDFRIDLMDAVSKFEITQEERSLLRRVQSIKRDNMKWSALSNSLSPTMLLTGNGGGMGAQLAFQVLLTAARTAVEYKEVQGGQNIEELQAMWDLRKEDMQTINELRKTAQGIVFDLYNKYHLKENDRLTESTANLFSEYVSEENAAKRIRILEDNAETYKLIPEFYYHLGMAYLDSNDYENAKFNFTKYLEMYKRTPFLRYDERSGCIALAILTYEEDLSDKEKIDLINLIVKNMPNNSAAILQCAMVYIYEMRLYEEGFKLLRSGIDNAHASDREILYMAAANLLPVMKNHTSIYNAISDTFKNGNDKGYDSYVTYLIFNGYNVWEYLNELNNFSECSHRTYYTLWLGKKFSSKFHLTLPQSVVYYGNDVLVYVEKHKDEDLVIHQLKSVFKNEINEDDINNVKCFKSNKNLKYLYVETIEPNVYKLKQNIDLNKISDETWPRQSEFVLSSGDIKDIIKFCKKYMPKSAGTELLFKNKRGPKQTVKTSANKDATFYGDTLAYLPFHSVKQDGYYVRMILRNNMQIVYKYEEGTLRPYFYSDTNKEYFWNDDSKTEYTSKESNDMCDEPSWIKQIWISVKEWFPLGKNGTVEQTQVETTTEVEDGKTSWFRNVWSYATGWLFSDDKEKSVNKK